MAAVSAEAKENVKRYLHQYYLDHKKENNRVSREYYRKNKRRVLKRLAENYKRNPEPKLFYQLFYKFGVTEELYKGMGKKQKWRCAICGGKQVNGNKNLDLDHNHKTKKPRGLLCGDCNRALGLFKDSPKLLLKAARYLEERS